MNRKSRHPFFISGVMFFYIVLTDLLMVLSLELLEVGVMMVEILPPLMVSVLASARSEFM